MTKQKGRKMKDTSTLQSNLAALIANKSKERGEEITMAEVAAETRLAPGTIRLLMRGSATRFDGHTIAVLCKYLGCRVEDLLKIVDGGKSSGNDVIAED
jgi:DNA-binding Xre family transcriptional regulator